MNAALRVAGRGDLDLVATLEAEIFAEDPWTPFMIAEELSSPASRYWIATDASGDVVGYGGAVLDTLLAWSREAGAREIFLDVRPSNEGAIGLYESRGFAEIGRRPRYFRNPVEEAIEMRAPLT